MPRTVIPWVFAAFFLSFPSQAPAQTPEPTAVVRLKIVYAWTGDDLGTAKVTLFKSKSDGKDHSEQFRDNVASTIPYGVYHLRAYHDGFWSADRQVVVNQPEVWVVMGLRIGMDHELNPFKLSGTIRHSPSADQPLWARLVGVHSTLLMDAKADSKGNFLMTGLPQDKCILIVWSGAKVLDIRPVDIPTDQSLEIDLAQLKERR